jgi:hypothetical protein
MGQALFALVLVSLVVRHLCLCKSHLENTIQGLAAPVFIDEEIKSQGVINMTDVILSVRKEVTCD